MSWFVVLGLKRSTRNRYINLLRNDTWKSKS